MRGHKADSNSIPGTAVFWNSGGLWVEIVRIVCLSMAHTRTHAKPPFMAATNGRPWSAAAVEPRLPQNVSVLFTCNRYFHPQRRVESGHCTAVLLRRVSWVLGWYSTIPGTYFPGKDSMEIDQRWECWFLLAITMKAQSAEGIRRHLPVTAACLLIEAEKNGGKNRKKLFI